MEKFNQIHVVTLYGDMVYSLIIDGENKNKFPLDYKKYIQY